MVVSTLMSAGGGCAVALDRQRERNLGDHIMAWNKPVVTEICMAMEINGYMPVEF